jgi:hypothetical protein
LDVERFPSGFIGTSVIPHFGHWPGSARTTSGCIGQVYLCVGDAEGDGLAVGSAIAVAAKVIAIAIKIKIGSFMSMVRLIIFL